MQSPKWCRTNRQAWHRALGDRGLSCPAGPTRNSANLLRCGRQIRLRKLPNGCTACARRYAGRQCGCAKRDCCRPIFPSISTSIRQSGRGRSRDQGSGQNRCHPSTTTRSDSFFRRVLSSRAVDHPERHARGRRPMRCTKNTLGGSGATLDPWSQALQKMFRLIPTRGF